MTYQKNRSISACIAFGLSLFAVLAFIFLNSLTPATESAAESGQIFSVLEHILGFLPFLTHNFVRKLAHFSEYALLGAHLFFLPIALFRKIGVRSLAAALFCGVPISLIDEGLQFFAPGRHASLVDSLIDMSGVCCGFFVFTFLFLFLGCLKCKKTKEG